MFSLSNSSPILWIKNLGDWCSKASKPRSQALFFTNKFCSLGAPLRQESVLNLLSDMESAEKELFQKQNRLNTINEQIRNVSKTAERYDFSIGSY